MTEPTTYIYKPQTKMRNSRAKEWRLQASCVTYLRKMKRYDKWFRDNVEFIANMAEGQRSPVRANIAKMMGLDPGVGDLIVLIKGKLFKVLWCELKKPERRNHKDGGLSEAQKGWFDWLSDTPVQCHLLYTLDEFIALMDAQRKV